jgi:Ca-activated chloride channel family protein
MKFGHPENLKLLWLIIPIVGLLVYALVKKVSALERFGESKLMKVLAASVSRSRQVWKVVFISLAAVCLIFAYAAPQIGERLKEVKRQGIDIVIALDVSTSMRAEDVKPSRLEKAKYEIINFLEKLGGDRVALVVFAGEAFTQCPMTLDKSAVKMFLDVVSTDAIELQGTSIVGAVQEAIKVFRDSESDDNRTIRNKVLIIVSDGEDNDQGIDYAIDRATSQDLKVFTVGIGSGTGVPIPIYDKQGNRIDFKKDRQGQVVTTKLEEFNLQKIADKTGGTYFRVDAQGSNFDRIFIELQNMQKQEFASKEMLDYDDKFQYLVGIAIFLLVLEIVMNDRKWKKSVQL